MTNFVLQTQLRVDRIISTLGMIDRSAKSQKIDQAQLMVCLAPLIAELRTAGLIDAPDPLPVLKPAAPLPIPDFASMDPRRFPAAVNVLPPEVFHALVAAVAVRAADDLAERG